VTFQELLDAAKKAPHGIAQDGAFRINIMKRTDGSERADCFIFSKRVRRPVLEAAMAPVSRRVQ